MRFLTVTSCCGYDLETGGILLGLFDLIPTLVFFPRNPISFDFAYSGKLFFTDRSIIINNIKYSYHDFNSYNLIGRCHLVYRNSKSELNQMHFRIQVKILFIFN